MHSSVLRGSDFQLYRQGAEVSHADFFRNHSRNTRLGLFAPNGTEGVGAVTFAMACVTAFYNRYREDGGGFFTYPDFFSFQRGGALADYCSFDFWPNMDVRVPDDPEGTITTIADRAINVLLVPDRPAAEMDYDPVQLDRARRSLSRSFAYANDGQVAGADLTIRCAVEPLRTYAVKVLRSADSALPDWLQRLDEGSTFEQSFRQLDPVDALARL